MDELNKRVIQIMESMAISKSQFALDLGISLPVLTHISSGRNKPSLDLIIRILHIYKNIDVNWLLFGQGNMYASETKKIDLQVELEQMLQEAKKLAATIQSLNEVIKYNNIFINEIKYLEQLNIMLKQQQDKGIAISNRLNSLVEEIKSKL